MKDLILHAYEKNKSVAIYSNPNNPDFFSVGRIISMDEDSVIVEEIDCSGIYDGYSIVNLCNIFRFETESKYIKMIELLNQFNCTRPYIQIELKKDNTVSMLSYCINNKTIIKLRLFESDADIFGFVIHYDEAFLKINQISTSGEFDGVSTIKIDRIEHIATQRTECRCIKNLFDYKEIDS